MDHLIHRTPSVGSIIKKMISINPDLDTMQLIDIIRKSTLVQEQSGIAGEFAQAQIIDEQQALSLTRGSLKSN
ncbi:hypothetical protein WDW37_19695 [Bdellovibrionota bacterium FG-1]